MSHIFILLKAIEQLSCFEISRTSFAFNLWLAYFLPYPHYGLGFFLFVCLSSHRMSLFMCWMVYLFLLILTKGMFYHNYRQDPHSPHYYYLFLWWTVNQLLHLSCGSCTAEIFLPGLAKDGCPGAPPGSSCPGPSSEPPRYPWLSGMMPSSKDLALAAKPESALTYQ